MKKWRKYEVAGVIKNSLTGSVRATLYGYEGYENELKQD